MPENTDIRLETYLPDSLHNKRLDYALSQVFSDYSREQLKLWIQSGLVQVDGQIIDKIRTLMRGGEHVIIQAPLLAREDWHAQDIPLSIIYEDDDLLVIDKPAGLVVHPGAGNPDNTLVNALLHHAPTLNQLPRAGLIHRLDKDTSGLLVVAKTLTTHQALVTAMQQRQITREYLAIVEGLLLSDGVVEQPMGRHPRQRTKMAVVQGGKPARTHYHIEHRFRAHTQLSLRLDTGRTHQIRVHMAFIRHPLLGDKRYGARMILPKQAEAQLIATIRAFERQALHARRLCFNHPKTHQLLEFKSIIPKDLENLINQLNEDKKAHG